MCTSQGYCAYPDPQCESGLRYGADAASGLEGMCLSEHDVANGTTTGGGSGAFMSSGSASLDTSTGFISSSGSTGTSAVTGGATVSSTTGEVSGGSSGSDTVTGGACGHANEPCCSDSACGDGLHCERDICSCVDLIAVGARHSCAVLTGGDVQCWGANDVGQIGPRAAEGSPVPVLSFAALEGDPIIAIDAHNHTCVLQQSGTVTCWGANQTGQVNPMAPATAVGATTATWSSEARFVATGAGHTCTASDSAVLCWGDNSSYQLSGTESDMGPVTVSGGAVAALRLGDAHTCGIVDESALCWGDNTTGQLAVNWGSVTRIATAREVTAVVGAQQVALGSSHSCALDADGHVWCWGRGQLGQLGIGSTTQIYNPAMALLPGSAGAVVQLLAAFDQTCVITELDELWCWGSNSGGQLMLDPDSMGFDTYAVIPTHLDVGRAVLAAGTGAGHSCALADDGTIVCWGTNRNGQIGDGSTNYAVNPREVLLQCP